jgi:muconolactone delta-isomerase
MSRVVITHAVQDIQRWLAGKAERAAALPGATNVIDLVAMDGTNLAAVAFDLDDLDALKAMLSAMPPDMAAQAESHGVVVATVAVYVRALAERRFRHARHIGLLFVTTAAGLIAREGQRSPSFDTTAEWSVGRLEAAVDGAHGSPDPEPELVVEDPTACSKTNS